MFHSNDILFAYIQPNSGEGEWHCIEKVKNSDITREEWKALNMTKRWLYIRVEVIYENTSNAR